MSILTSQAERDDAAARLKDKPAAALEADLVYWTVAAVDTGEEFHRTGERLAELRDRHAEEKGWIQLHAEELRRRRDENREEAQS